MLVHKKLRAELAQELRDKRAIIKTLIDDLRVALIGLEPLAAELDRAGIDWRVGYRSLTVVTVGKTKKDFSDLVERVSKALNEPPNISVSATTYSAAFREGKIHVYSFYAEDCRVIEVEETTTRKVLKPHPSCVAALLNLENLA